MLSRSTLLVAGLALAGTATHLLVADDPAPRALAGEPAHLDAPVQNAIPVPVAAAPRPLVVPEAPPRLPQALDEDAAFERELAELSMGGKAAASLDSLNDKQTAKTQKQLDKQQKRLVKLEAKRTKLLTLQADWEEQLAAYQLDLAAGPAAVAAAEQALADALAMPQGTPEQAQAREDAIQAAKQALKQAQTSLKQATKGVPRMEKKLAKLALRLGKVESRIAEVSATIDELEAALETLVAPFSFASLGTLQVAGTLTDPGSAPVTFAQVMVVDPLAWPGSGEALQAQVSAAVYWRGFSQEDGSFGGALQLPAHRDEVDIVVTKSGYEGPYSDEALRAHWGVFAPAARVTVAVEDLDTLALVLSEVAP